MAATIDMPTKHGEPLKLYQIAEDILVPEIFLAVKNNVHMIADLEARHGDVLVCSFPKSGTHWTGALVREIVMRSVSQEQIGTYKNQRLGLLEKVPEEKLASALSPRIMSLHLRPKRLPTSCKEGKSKIVLVLRNPKDVAVSFYHHLKNSAMNNQQDWVEYLDSFKSGIVPFGQYLEYLDDWEQAIKNNKNLDLEIFYYEDLKANGLDTVRRLAKHLGFVLTDDEVQDVLDECSMTKLADNHNKLIKGTKAPVMGKDGKSVIFRKGEIADWKNHFTVAQNDLYDEILNEFSKRSMFKFQYE